MRYYPKKNFFWKRSALKAQQISQIFVRNATFAMFLIIKLERNATSAIEGVAEVVLCASNCALPTFGMSVCQSRNTNLHLCGPD